MKKYLILTYLSCIVINMFGQNQDSYRLKSFIINGEEQPLNDNYTFYFVCQTEHEKIIYIPTMKNDTFYESEIIPPEKDIFYYWLLNYNGKIYYLNYIWFFDFKEHVDIIINIETESYVKYNKDKWEQKCKYSSDSTESLVFSGVVYMILRGYGGGVTDCLPFKDMETYLRKGEEILGFSNSFLFPKHKRKKRWSSVSN